MSSGLPTTVECAFRTELPLQTWRLLRQPVIKDENMRGDDENHLDEKKVVRFCEKVVRDGCYLATDGNAGQLCPPLSVSLSLCAQREWS